MLFRSPGIASDSIRRSLRLDGKFVACFAGFYGPWHGVEYLAKAVRIVSNRQSNVQFVFIGDQKLAAVVSAICDAEGTKAAITCVINVPHSEMPSYYAACDVLVSPHVHMADGSTFFGSPVKIFEYMAMGKPIVASGVGQIAELLKDHVNALLTTPGDVNALAEAILTLAGDPDLRSRLGASARETCLSKCTWLHNAERFVAACHDLSQIGVEPLIEAETA